MKGCLVALFFLFAAVLYAYISLYLASNGRGEVAMIFSAAVLLLTVVLSIRKVGQNRRKREVAEAQERGRARIATQKKQEIDDILGKYQ